nr:M23 family metallopeptidase [uncultured Butyricicoccus sp.]
MRKQGYTSQPKKVDRGFYVILSICLVVIAVSSYVLFFAPAANESKTTDSTLYLPTGDTVVQEPVSVPDVDVPAEPTVQPEPEAVEQPVEPKPQQEQQPEQTDTAAQTAAEAPAPIWVKPVDGEVIKTFSGETLVKDETMGDWRVHTGTDYAASSGTRVYAVSDGTVERAEADAQYGGVVVLNLSDGKQAVYQCLAGDNLKVSAGDTVRAGDVIGTVGTEGYAEAGQESHLHLELYANGEAIDPESVFGSAEQTVSESEEPAVASMPDDGIYVEE